MKHLVLNLSMNSQIMAYSQGGFKLTVFFRPCQLMKSYVWLQTSDGSIQQVEQEVAIFCPFICHEIHLGLGSSKNYPISLPPTVNLAMLSMILDYCHFHQVPGRSNKVLNFLSILRFGWITFHIHWPSFM